VRHQNLGASADYRGGQFSCFFISGFPEKLRFGMYFSVTIGA
jgi:hypothetical protein